MPPKTIKIAIIGAGPTGLLLAPLLHKHNIPFTLFESDSSPTSRPQGGTLDLHPKTGIAALISKVARFEGSALSVCDKNAQQYFEFPTVFGNNPEIDRAQLKGLLWGLFWGIVSGEG
ncbi:hypothetical protein BJX76DRAFT_358131 [Aspergillus varians]